VHQGEGGDAAGGGVAGGAGAGGLRAELHGGEGRWNGTGEEARGCACTEEDVRRFDDEEIGVLQDIDEAGEVVLSGRKWEDEEQYGEQHFDDGSSIVDKPMLSEESHFDEGVEDGINLVEQNCRDRTAVLQDLISKEATSPNQITDIRSTGPNNSPSPITISPRKHVQLHVFLPRSCPITRVCSRSPPRPHCDTSGLRSHIGLVHQPPSS